MGVLRRLREWREKRDGTLEGPALHTDGLQVNGEYHWASSFDGSTHEDRLSNAISAADDGDLIFLETQEYEEDRSINKRVTLAGTTWGPGSAGDLPRTKPDTDWTMTERGSAIVGFNVAGDITIGDGCLIQNSSLFETVTVTGDDAAILNCRRGSVVFESDTSNGIVDSCIRTDVTDNGDNLVGDIT